MVSCTIPTDAGLTAGTYARPIAQDPHYTVPLRKFRQWPSLQEVYGLRQQTVTLSPKADVSTYDKVPAAFVTGTANAYTND